MSEMIEPLLPFYNFFLSLVYYLPGPVKSFMLLVIALYGISSVMHLLQNIR